MRLFRYFDFLKKFESAEVSNLGIIGDSHVGLYTKLLPQLKTFTDSGVGLNKGGWSSTKLVQACQQYKKTHPEISMVFIKIGDNDGYRVNLATTNAPLLKKELQRIFPNAIRFVVIKGSWGWGGLTKFTTMQEPKEFVDYYKVWENQGFEVTQKAQGYVDSDAKSHSIHPGIRSQVADIEKMISGQEITAPTLPQDKLEDIKSSQDVDSYYGVLKSAIDTNSSCVQQDDNSYEYSNLVRCIQIGLKFLGYELPLYGVDGYYGPETAASIGAFKRDYKITTNQNIFDANDILSLMNALKEKGFKQPDLQNVWDQSRELSSKELADISGSPEDLNFIFYLPHQQGKAGTTQLILAYLGLGKLHPDTRKNDALYLRANCHRRDVKEAIFNAISMNDDKTAATLFLNYQRELWAKKRREAPVEILKPKHKIVKDILDSVPTNLPKDFIYTVCYIESGFNPESNRNNPKSSYKGLFAMTVDGLAEKIRKIFPNETPDVFNPKHNAFAGIKNVEEGISYIKSKVGTENLSKMGVTSKIGN